MNTKDKKHKGTEYRVAATAKSGKRAEVPTRKVRSHPPIVPGFSFD
jgi:hypothetical protein